MNTPATHTPTLRPYRAYRIRCAGLEYIALATGPAQAIADAIALHGVAGASAQPFAKTGARK